MSRSEVPHPVDAPTLRLAAPTCVSGEVGCSSQVLVRFSLDMPYSMTPVESTRAHHIARFILASITITMSPSTSALA